MKCEQSRSGSTIYSEGTFWLEIYPTSGRMFAYHHCPSNEGREDGREDKWTGIHNCLMTSEVREQECVYCGKIEMPDEMQALWHLYQMKDWS